MNCNLIISGQIERMEDWAFISGPVKKNQWKDDYSAMEFARLWFRKDSKGHYITEVPEQIQNIVNQVFGPSEILFCIPEKETQILDAGEGRHHDMFIYGVSENKEPFVVGIEAKVREDFDKLISQKLKDASKTKSESQIPARIDTISEHFCLNQSVINDLYYQLFTGAEGTAQETLNYKVKNGLFLIVQINPNEEIDTIIKQHEEDILRFVDANGSTIIKMNSTDSDFFAKLNTNSNYKDKNLYLGYVKINRKHYEENNQ